MIALFLVIIIAPQPIFPIIQQIETRAKKIQSFGAPRSLSGRDRLHTHLGNLGSNQADLIIYTSILTNEECLLKRYDETEKVCETIQRTTCNDGKSQKRMCTGQSHLAVWLIDKKSE